MSYFLLGVFQNISNGWRNCDSFIPTSEASGDPGEGEGSNQQEGNPRTRFPEDDLTDPKQR
jgi:hypothetical protein